jgi:hypothetical protein
MDLERRKIRRNFKLHSKAVYTFEWCGGVKTLASGGLEGDILLWSPYSKGFAARLSIDAAYSKPIRQLSSHASAAQLISLYADNSGRSLVFRMFFYFFFTIYVILVL